MPRILICGDSFGTSDPDYPGLHFSEKISQQIDKCEIINLSRGGASNKLIELQIQQGIKYKPDAVILLLTDPNRIEYLTTTSQYFTDKANKIELHCGQPWDKEIYFNYVTYLTNVQWNLDIKNIPATDSVHIFKRYHDNCLKYEGDDFSLIKNYLSILSALSFLKSQGIPSCFDLGGMAGPRLADIATPMARLTESLLSAYHMNNELEMFMDQKTNINLWHHATYNSDSPSFHVADDNIQTQFAENCIRKLNLK